MSFLPIYHLYEQVLYMIYVIGDNNTFPADSRPIHNKSESTAWSTVESMCALQCVHCEEARAKSGYGNWDDELNFYLKDIIVLPGAFPKAWRPRRDCDDKVLQRVNDN